MTTAHAENTLRYSLVFNRTPTSTLAMTQTRPASLTSRACGQIYCQQTLDDHIMPDADKILRMRTVLDSTGLSRSTLYRKMKNGTFPNQVRISEHCCGWRESAINRWMADSMSYREDGPANAPPGPDAPLGRRLLS